MASLLDRIPAYGCLKVKDAVATGVKLALDKAGIDMPYPHTVLLFHDATEMRARDSRRSDELLRSLNRTSDQARGRVKYDEYS